MKTLESGKNTAILELTANELLVINNALNEVCHGVKIIGFESRLGKDRPFAKELLMAIGQVLDQIPDSTE